MSNLKWLCDGDLVDVLRKERIARQILQYEIDGIQEQMNKLANELNSSQVRSEWANKYLMQDLTGTAWENDTQGWIEQREVYNGGKSAGKMYSSPLHDHTKE